MGMKYLVKCLQVNSNLKEINYLNNCVGGEHLDRFDFLIKSNQGWKNSFHLFLPLLVKKSFFTFLLFLKRNQKRNKIKIPKFVLFEIFKRVDMKSFYPLIFKKKKAKKRSLEVFLN